MSERGPSQEILLKEWDVTSKEMLANIDWQWETIRMYLTVMGFLLIAYNYLVYQFSIPYLQHDSGNAVLPKMIIVFVSLLIPILSIPITYYTVHIFEYRYRRFLDKAYTMNRLRVRLGLSNEDLKLYPPRYYDGLKKDHCEFVEGIIKRRDPPTFYGQGRKFIFVLEGIFLLEAIVVAILLWWI